MKIENLGLDIAVIGSIISIIGVIENNIFLNHIGAMQVWVVSNILLMCYFYGHWKGLWNGGLSSGSICLMYVVMLVSGVRGLMQ